MMSCLFVCLVNFLNSFCLSAWKSCKLHQRELVPPFATTEAGTVYFSPLWNPLADVRTQASLAHLALAQGWSSRLQYSSQPLPSGKHCTSHLLTAPSSWLCFQLTLWLRAGVGAKACRAVASWRVPFLLISPAIYLQSTRYLKRDVFFNAKSFSTQHSVWHCIYLRNG